MPYSDLIDLDERVSLVNSNFEKVDFATEEYEDGQRIVAHMGGVTVPVRTAKNLEKFSNAFGVPYKFAGEVSQDLLKNIFKELADRKTGDNYNWLIDTTNDTLVSYGDSKKPYVPFSRVGELMERHGFDLSGQLSRDGMGQITGTHEINGVVEPREGDITKSGVNIQFNPTMNTPPLVLPWSERLVCTNGMTIQSNRERVNVVGHNVDDILEQIDFQIGRSFEYAEQMNQRFAHLIDHQVNPQEFMQNIINSYNVPKRQRDALLVRAMTLSSENRTAYDVVNAFTEFSRDIYDRSARLDYQSIAGDMVISGELACNRCGSKLD